MGYEYLAMGNGELLVERKGDGKIGVEGCK
jgi:hypothetical protein